MYKIDSLPEQRKVVLVHVTVDDEIDWSRFSNFSRLQRAIAYCFRFLHNASNKSEKIIGSLTVQEIKHAQLKILQCIQRQSFSKEFKQLELRPNGDEVIFVSKESSIRSLNPFIDKDGLMRVNGRLAKADIDYNQKFPLLLPAKHYVVRLLIKLEHIKLFHAGPQTVLSNLRLKYWPIHGSEVKFVLKNCVICHRLKAQTSQQLMGALPLDRVSISRPFLKIVIDFGGPFFVKQSRLRKSVTSKAYIALFVCMVTKAIHIELVLNLSTEAFLLALKRFISRRGHPITIYSDNATNFKGANNQLRDLYLFFKSQENKGSIENFLSQREIEWNFIPPNSPHWGGLWEAGIKSTKYHLRRIVGNTCLSFEELTTVLTQIEAILNSRGLSPISSDPSDFNCLTPSHFLIGEPLTSYPERDVADMPENRLKFWENCCKIQQSFWKRWSVEYLNQLQNRPKWFSSTKNLEENMVVLVKEDNSPPLKWHLARIIEVIPGSDGKVRVAKIKTKEGIFTRSITKLCPLPHEIS